VVGPERRLSVGLRIGHGFDAHRLVPGRPCVLGGVAIASEVGPEGHSDGDVVLHALTDALLGASAAGDLGSVFGTNRPEWKGASSEHLVAAARSLTGRPPVVNVDVTVIGDRPRLGAHREAMRERIAALLEIPVGRVSVKASSGNGLTDFGRGEGVAATVILLVEARPA
jgi:2-C-methyl-D-erythritol 4-phosphate cytidylyltransferase/2-C-methyl-D-erythritol 2,4-cyclodiphosphate synthase